MWPFKKKLPNAIKHSCRPSSVKHLRTPSGCKVWIYCACGEVWIYKKDAPAPFDIPDVLSMTRLS